MFMQKSTAVTLSIYFIILTFRRIVFYSWQQETFASFHRLIVGFPQVRRGAQE